MECPTEPDETGSERRPRPARDRAGRRLRRSRQLRGSGCSGPLWALRWACGPARGTCGPLTPRAERDELEHLLLTRAQLAREPPGISASGPSNGTCRTHTRSSGSRARPHVPPPRRDSLRSRASPDIAPAGVQRFPSDVRTTSRSPTRRSPDPPARRALVPRARRRVARVDDDAPAGAELSGAPADVLAEGQGRRSARRMRSVSVELVRERLKRCLSRLGLGDVLPARAATSDWDR
jgi:hypothetical protein